MQTLSASEHCFYYVLRTDTGNQSVTVSIRNLYIAPPPHLILFLYTMTTIILCKISTARHRHHDRSLYKIPRSCQLTPMRLAPLTAWPHRYRDFLPVQTGKKSHILHYTRLTLQHGSDPVSEPFLYSFSRERKREHHYACRRRA